MKRYPYKVGDWVGGDGWSSTFRVCKVTSRTVWLWNYGQSLDRPTKRPYFSFRYPDILSKTGATHYDDTLRGYGHKTENLKPFRRL